MLESLEARGVTVDLTVEPGAAPHGPLLDGERANGVTPDYREVPAVPYRSSPAAFPAAEPGGRSGPLLVPLLSGRRFPGGQASTIPLEYHPSLFALRLLAKVLRGPPPVLAFAVRTDPRTLGAWDTVVANLEHIARHDVRFITASTAANEIA